MIDWNAMSPREVFDALVTRPKRVAGPWEPAWVDGGGTERCPPCRKTPDGNTVVWERAEDEGVVVVHAHAVVLPGVLAGASISCDSRAEADKVLRDAGWLLVEEPAIMSESFNPAAWVGRPVQFTHAWSELGPVVVLAAIITRVEDANGEYVSLRVFNPDPNGEDLRLTRAQFIAAHRVGKPDAIGRWSWPEWTH